MQPGFLLLAMGAGLMLAACESLPLDLPGQGAARTASQAPVETESPIEEPSSSVAADSRDGLTGAAMCASAAYYLADNGMMAEADATALANTWISILEVVPAASFELRQTAVDSAYATFEAMEAREEELGLQAAAALYNGKSCGDPAFQRDYLARWGDPALMQAQLEDGE